jgi:hypothetical protein
MEYEGALYHITGRDNERKRIFTEDDRTRFPELVQDRSSIMSCPARIVQFDFVVVRTCFEAASLVRPNLRTSSDLFSVQR